MNEVIAQKLKDLPSQPGVYLMRSQSGELLYIGKARSLKNRVRQYFGSPKNKTQKVLIMVSKIADFDYIITRNEIEALVLENNLIKKHKPPYNILLKDDKAYPFIKIRVKDDYPKIEVVRKLKKDDSKYFGPYMQGISAKEITDLIASAFPLRTCNINMSKVPSSHRPCLNNHINRCLAPCSGNVSKEEYHKIVNEVVKFLSGNDKSIAGILKSKMARASAEEDFELAIYYRDKLAVLDKIIRKQVTALPNESNLDIFAVSSNGMYTVASVLVVRGGKLLGGDKQVINDASLSPEIALGNFIISYYDNAPMLADEVITDIELDDAELIAEYLSEYKGKKVNVITPIQGVRRQLADMAESNARDYLVKCVGEAERRENMTIGGVLQLQEYLGLKRLPMRMECFDISHISGTDMVSSMVVFNGGESDKKMYRKFKIKTVEGNNDFACMKETLIRRLNHLSEEETDASFSQSPDLIVVDGGKGQLSYALEALAQTGHKNMQIISLAEREEEVYLPNRSEPVILPRDSFALTLLQRIRDEAHRFAITFHKQLRAKRQTASELKEIKGIGDKTVAALFDKFKTMANIKAAQIDELAMVKGVNIRQAEAIYAHFRQTD